jgi:hypothetical protein
LNAANYLFAIRAEPFFEAWPACRLVVLIQFGRGLCHNLNALPDFIVARRHGQRLDKALDSILFPTSPQQTADQGHESILAESL